MPYSQDSLEILYTEFLILIQIFINRWRCALSDCVLKLKVMPQLLIPKHFSRFNKYTDKVNNMKTFISLYLLI